MGDRAQDWDRLSGTAKARLLARLLSHVVHTACFGEVRISYKDLAAVPELGFVPDGEHVVVATGARQPPKGNVYLLSLDPDGACSLDRMNGNPPPPKSKTVATFVAPSDEAADRIATLITQENMPCAPTA